MSLDSRPPLPRDVRTDQESLLLADAFSRLSRVEEFAQFRGELEREQGILVDELTVGHAGSYDKYLEIRGIWNGLERALRLIDVVVEEATSVEEERNDND
jgi:hypothetical protein